MTKDTILLLALGLLVNGCYSNKLVTVSSDSQESVKELNRNVHHETVQIYLVSGDSFKGKSVHVTKDSTFWLDAETESTRHGVATSDISSISREYRNTAKGLGYGFLMGAALGALISQTGDDESYDCDDAEGFCFTRSEAAVLGIILVGPPAGLLGLISGALTKTTERYEFK